MEKVNGIVTARPNSAFRVTMVLDKSLTNMATTVSQNLAGKVLPRALDAAAAAVEPILESLLPDGTQSRKLQTAKARAMWPGKMKVAVATKKLRPRQNQVLRIVGLDRSALHARFDHGNKAIDGAGRVHILWGKKFALVNPRKQRHDIAKIAAARVEPVVANIVKQHIEHAIEKGELL